MPHWICLWFISISCLQKRSISNAVIGAIAAVILFAKSMRREEFIKRIKKSIYMVATHGTNLRTKQWCKWNGHRIIVIDVNQVMCLAMGQQLL